jgi:hypothetical protein
MSNNLENNIRPMKGPEQIETLFSTELDRVNDRLYALENNLRCLYQKLRFVMREIPQPLNEEKTSEVEEESPIVQEMMFLSGRLKTSKDLVETILNQLQV